MTELEHFAGASGDNRLKAWLESQRDEAVKYLTNAVELPQIHRAQGRVLFIERMLELMDKAKNLR